jgi:hypothetical protein
VLAYNLTRVPYIVDFKRLIAANEDLKYLESDSCAVCELFTDPR